MHLRDSTTLSTTQLAIRVSWSARSSLLDGESGRPDFGELLPLAYHKVIAHLAGTAICPRIRGRAR